LEMGASRPAQTYEAGQASRTHLVHKFKNASCGRVSESNRDQYAGEDQSPTQVT
jgi:hypothetical protein